MSSYKLGIDTGGTYTDAVLLSQEGDVIASAKALTTRQDLALGITEAVSKVIGKHAEHISLVGLSTTLATNAVVEGEGHPVAVILPGYSEQQLQRAALNQAIGNNPVILISGGHNAWGKENEALDINAAREFIQKHAKTVAAFAVSSLFAVRNTEHELLIQKIIQEESGLPCTLGHHLSGSLDAPRRALTATLNARLIPLTDRLINDVERALSNARVKAPLMVVKGDGSLISAALARQIPVETILSGPAASVVGTKHLTNQPNLIVSDMGGTTTDVCLLQEGQPHLSDSGASVGGWRTMVEAVQVFSYGLGGDSDIHFNREKRAFDVGPRRVIPLSLLALQYPNIIAILEEQYKRGWIKTHDGRFVLRRADLNHTRMSPRQRALWDKLESGPVAVTDLFDDRTASSTLNKMIERGWVTQSGFTPSDAAHACQKQSDWSTPAAVLGAKLRARYSKENLGKTYDDEIAFAEAMLDRVSVDSAGCILDSIFENSDSKAKSHQQSIDFLLDRKHAPLAKFRAQLDVPIAAVGAPAATYYDKTAEWLGTNALHLKHASVANAIGAVVGQVRQSVKGSVQPVSTHEFNAHTPTGIEKFTDLESAVSWAQEQMGLLASTRAETAGCAKPSLQFSRHDVIVDEFGEKTFFESQLSVVATGLPTLKAE